MKNKTTSILFFCLVIVACSSVTKKKTKNYFEGRIFYKSEYIIKSNNVSSTYLKSTYGETTELFFKEGNYLEKYDGGFVLEQLYNKQDNKTYFKKNLSDTLYWLDCTMPGQEMLKFEINPKKEKILGIDCDELITYYDNRTVSFYYNPDSLKIEPDWYKNFTRSNKNILTKKMKAVYIKFKIEYPEFIAIVTATSIIREKIDDKIFLVSKDKILIEDK